MIGLLEDRVGLLQGYVDSERKTLQARVDETQTKHMEAMKKLQRDIKRVHMIFPYV